MTEDKEQKIIDSKNGIFNDLTNRFKLIMRLISDPRVSPFLKLLPIGSVLYFIIPDLAPGPIDDVAIIWLGTFLFVELCPPHVVQEHMEALGYDTAENPQDAQSMDGDVIDAEYWETKE
jgi:hypothetical protein